MNERDSGWRLMVGMEDDKYSNDAQNISMNKVGWLTDFDPSLHEILKNDIGAVFERGSKAEPWRKGEDWHPREE
jgi:hypothetical protein